MQYDENLAKFLSKNPNTLYIDFLGQKILILSSLNIKNEKEKVYVFGFEEENIFKLDNVEFKPLSLNDFLNIIRTNLDEYKAENAHFESIIEHKENILLKGNLIKNFFKKSFILKQKINRNLKNLSLLNEALNLLAETSPHKKALRPLIFGVNIALKNSKEILTRLNELHLLISAIKNERINQSLYFLSVLSAIFLPLNLIVGFFGMNTNGLFLNGNKNATWYIFTLICFILIIGLVVYYKKRKKELEFDDKISKKTHK
ncbi:CorA family divalent cation transporter [Campylobacter aviculae]|uniref:Magnesium transporter CorA n=1 Tax=Campylobacter aviculae TaxID=2510190 RepID=A0A4U7BM52_9BACT|nr:CorA family divalent cation transporter [Campylobacter aviculae]TKX33173.1 magnesium transporter CorA [Campylobacter aviculae]